jgi:hypothetical protein|tara:strand:- start:251 stop:511 length:261 start_codon:yes stop_codon:yes gene_type:complete
MKKVILNAEQLNAFSEISSLLNCKIEFGYWAGEILTANWRTEKRSFHWRENPDLIEAVDIEKYDNIRYYELNKFPTLIIQKGKECL